MQSPLKFNAEGLVPAILQDHVTGQIRMFAYASPAAVRMTLETGLATFWSRSRGELWQRGRVGGRETPVVRVIADCDGDCIIYSCDPQSPSCHSGAPSCFFHTVESDRLVQASDQPQTALSSLESSLESKEVTSGSTPPPNYVPAGLAAKLGERVESLTHALELESDERVIHEAAEAICRLVEALRVRRISLRNVLSAVARRAGAEGAVRA
jgi:phosphoribosyl-AMP cyclohydrolase / phosphoribosyl-ATP pyrophosphohydrolase